MKLEEKIKPMKLLVGYDFPENGDKCVVTTATINEGVITVLSIDELSKR